MTALVAKLKGGHMLPHSFVFSGVNKMQWRFEPLHPEIFKDETGAPHWLTRFNWYQNGFMKMSLLPIFIKHILVNTRKIVPEDKKFV